MASAYLKRQYRGYAFKQMPAYTDSNIYHPVLPVLPSDPGAPPQRAESKLSSIALNDTLSLNGDKVQLTLGVRRQSH